MLILRSPEQSIDVPDTSMRRLIEQRFATLVEEEMLNTSYFIVFEPQDTMEALDAQLGLPVLTSRFDDSRFGEPGFTPSFELIEEHPCCYEMVFVLGDDGSGVLVFIPRSSRSMVSCWRFVSVTPSRRRSPVSDESPDVTAIGHLRVDCGNSMRYANVSTPGAD